MQKLAAVDLNLLVALDALLSHKSVTAAGRATGKSQPAMSHALASLRALLDDPILVRDGAVMRLTVLGESLAPEVARLIASIEATLLGERAFAPEEAANTFRVSTNDYCGAVILPGLCAAVRSAAPGVQLEFHPHRGPAPAHELARGEIDVALGTFLEVERGLRTETLWRERFVCVVREGNARARKKLSLERYVALDHLVVSAPSYGAGVVDHALGERGLSRSVAVRVPHFLVAPAIVAGTDLVATLPEKIARPAAAAYGLRVMEAPIELAPFTVDAVWHERAERSASLRWLLRQLREAARAHSPRE